MQLPTLGKTILTACAAILLSGCVAMREKGTINLPEYQTSKPSVYLTASYSSYKNGQLRAFMNEYCRKDLLKTAEQKAKQTNLFGAIHTENQPTDLQIHCALRCEMTHNWADFWMSVATLQLYAEPYTYEYTLRTTVMDRRTKKKHTFTSNDILTTYNSIWLLPVAPFMPLTTRAKEMEQYLFDSTVAWIAQKGLLTAP